MMGLSDGIGKEKKRENIIAGKEVMTRMATARGRNIVDGKITARNATAAKRGAIQSGIGAAAEVIAEKRLYSMYILSILTVMFLSLFRAHLLWLLLIFRASHFVQTHASNQ